MNTTISKQKICGAKASRIQATLCAAAADRPKKADTDADRAAKPATAEVMLSQPGP